MSASWYIGYEKFVAGRPFTACVTGDELKGWLAAMGGEAACGVLDVMAANGASPEDMDVFLSSIEDDHDWIRTGC